MSNAFVHSSTNIVKFPDRGLIVVSAGDGENKPSWLRDIPLVCPRTDARFRKFVARFLDEIDLVLALVDDHVATGCLYITSIDFDDHIASVTGPLGVLLDHTYPAYCTLLQMVRDRDIRPVMLTDDTENSLDELLAYWQMLAHKMWQLSNQQLH